MPPLGRVPDKLGVSLESAVDYISLGSLSETLVDAGAHATPAGAPGLLTSVCGVPKV